MWEYGRKPWTFNSGGAGSGIYVTYDGGLNWEKRTKKDGLPEGPLGRVGLAFAPSKPNVVYALVEAKKNAVYKSEDGGHNWKKVADKNFGNRPFYYADIFVDPENENRVFSLHSRVSKSEDGGKTFQSHGNRGLHPDHHAFWVHPENPNYIINGNDGGLNISHDGGATYRFVENLPLAQFYHINYDMDIPYNVAGGMQDNGSWVGPSSIWKRGGILNEDWQEVYFGDGFDVVFRPDDNRYVYAMSQGGNVGYIDRVTGNSQFIKPVHPEGLELRFNWNAAIAQNPFHSCGIYFGSQFVHKSMDCGQSWTIISPDLTTNDPEKQKQYESGGLTIDDTQAENFTTIVAISPSPVDENVIWVGTDDGNLQLTRDGGQSWTNLADRLPDAKAGSWIPYIEVSTENSGEAFVVVNDYRRNDWRPMVYHTSDFGTSFTRIANENQVSGYALAVVQDLEAPNLLWLGTDHGLYFTIDGGENWNKWTNDYPSVPTHDLKIHPREQDLIVGTFGRAAWVLDDIRPIREIAKTKGAILEQPFKVFEAPDAYLASYRSYDGMHFPASATYRGQNRSSGAMITVWNKAQKPKAKQKGDSKETAKNSGNQGGRKQRLKVKVLNASGDTIRNFSTEIDTGMTRIYWGMTRDGVRYPSRRSPRPNAGTPSGSRVLPGTYKLLFSYGKHKDSINLTIHADPRLDISLADLEAKQAAYDAYYEVVNKATEGFDRLKEAKSTISRVNQALSNAPDSLKKEINKIGKALQDSIGQLEELYMQPQDFKGIQRSTGKLNSTLFSASRYINASKGAPNQGAQISIDQAKAQTAEVLEKINTFFNKDFSDYQKKVEAVQFSLFKGFEPIKLE